MEKPINGMLAEEATALVHESFTGVRAEWWWERRIEGGIELCQEFAPEAMVRDISGKTGRSVDEVREVTRTELGLEDLEPVVLTFEIPGDTPAPEAARLLAERSSTPEGLASGLYIQLEEAMRRRFGR
jgi:hypothetical protein